MAIRRLPQSMVEGLVNALAGKQPAVAAERGVFAPDLAEGDLTPVQIRDLIGGNGFYKLCGLNGTPIQFPASWAAQTVQTYGVVEGFVCQNNLYGYSWQQMTGHSTNRVFIRRAVTADTWTNWAEVFHSQVNSATMRDTLNVAQKQVSPSDATEGRGLIVGAFGLGSGPTGRTYLADADTLTRTGFYITGASWVGSPYGTGSSGQSQGYLNHYQWETGYARQEFYSINTLYLSYWRRMDAGVWTRWFRNYDQTSAVGSVSNTDGLPSGGIIERGSNANGDYTKFADGTLVCFSSIVTAAAAAGGGSSSKTITFPTAFVAGSGPVLTYSIASGAPALYDIGFYGHSGTGYTVSFVNRHTAAASITVHVIAHGRWF